jgi:hypothetical protein
MVACVTLGLRAPGVRAGSGSPGSRSAVDIGPDVASGTPVGPGVKEDTESELGPVSSSPSAGVAPDEAVGMATLAGVPGAVNSDDGEAAPTMPGDIVD